MIRRSTIWSDPRVKPPFGSAEIDWSHPQAGELVACVLFNEAGGSPVDLVFRGRPTIIGASTWTPTLDGIGWNARGTDALGYPARPAYDGNAITFVWRGIFTAIPSFAGIVVIADSVGYHYTLQETASSFAVYENGGLSNDTGITVTEAATYHHGAVVIFSDGTGVKGYLNAVLQATTAFTPGAAVTGKPLRIGADRGAVPIFITGTYDHLFLYARALSQERVSWAYAEPYAFLRPVIRRRWFMPSAAEAPAGSKVTPRSLGLLGVGA